jgi:transposase
MDPAPEALPDDVAALKAALATERARRLEVAAELAVARAKASEDMALIAAQKLRIAKLERQIYGQRSERSERLIEQLSLTFEELAASATEDELAAEQAVAKATSVRAFIRRAAERDTFPDHLPRERVVIDPPTACECCGGTRLRKLGEDVTRTLETSPRRWKVIETVREKFSCRDCEKISQAPAPFHVIPRAWAGPGLLAMIVFEKFGQHQPLNRQAERYALEGAPIALSTMADAVGAVCATLDPLRRLIEAHVMAAERLHGDDTTVPVLAQGKTDTGRLWTYVRDDKPFSGAGPPAAIFYYSRDRKGEHPQAHLAGYAGILQADAYDGYNKLYLPGRKPGPIREAACRVGGDVAIPAPHRPGRADYPHPVLHAQASLRKRRRCERAMVEAADVARAWRQNATTTACCGDRVGRAISSKFARAGGDTNGAAGCFPRCHSRRSAPGSSETGGRAARETGGAGFAGTIRSRRPRRARNGLSPLSGAPRPCLSATCPRRG